MPAVGSRIAQESHYVGVSSGDRLHMRRIWDASVSDESLLGPPTLFIHGAIENGKVFYTESGRGLAPYLASRGFDCYVLDLRGRGGSVPRVSRSSGWGQLEAIVEDIPAASAWIAERRPQATQSWIAHSWGGVLGLAALARDPSLAQRISAMAFFGTKRAIHVQHAEKALKVDLFWNRLGPLIARLWGYLPARALRAGADDESRLALEESISWVKPGPWRDPRDDFDYEKALRSMQLPPMLFMAGSQDRTLGHPKDVRALMRETGSQETEYWLLARAAGFRRDYDHVDMLTHPEAPVDHFPRLAEWLKKSAVPF